MTSTGAQDWQAFIVAAFALIRSGHPKVARQKAKQALYAARQLAETSGQAVLLCEAVLAYLRSRLHRAEHFFELVSNQGQFEDTSLEHEMLELFAETKFHLGKYGASADLLKQAMQASLADIEVTGARMRRLARIYTLLEEDALARAYYRLAQELLNGLNGAELAETIKSQTEPIPSSCCIQGEGSRLGKNFPAPHGSSLVKSARCDARRSPLSGLLD